MPKHRATATAENTCESVRVTRVQSEIESSADARHVLLVRAPIVMSTTLSVAVRGARDGGGLASRRARGSGWYGWRVTGIRGRRFGQVCSTPVFRGKTDDQLVLGQDSSRERSGLLVHLEVGTGVPLTRLVTRS